MFTEADVISSYSREQAIEDGVLVEMDPDFCRKAGYRVPVALTARLWALVDPSEALKAKGQSLEGRLWDLFWMGRLAIRSAGDDPICLFKCLFLEEGKAWPTLHEIKLTIGPGDDLEPVMTFMFSDED